MDFLNEVEKKLDLAPAEKEQVMRELKSHYFDLRDELLASGIQSSQVEQEAARRMGNPEDIAARLSATHNSASWKSALLCAVPYIGYALCFVPYFVLHYPFPFLIQSVTMAIAIILTIGSLRELIHSRRPIWLSTWMAGAFLGLLAVCYNPNQNHYYILYLVNNIILAITVLILAYYYRYWVKTAVTIGFLSVGLSLFLVYYPTKQYELALLFICGLIMKVLIARYIFELHQYGNGAKASLFILALLTITLPPGELQTAFLLFHNIAIALTVIWFARVPSYSGKLTALFVALLTNAAIRVMAILYVTRYDSYHQFYLIQTLNFLTFGVPVFIPMLMYRRKNRQMAAD